METHSEKNFKKMYRVGTGEMEKFMQEPYKLPRQAVHICQRSETVAVETSQCHDFEAMVSANKSLARDVCAL